MKRLALAVAAVLAALTLLLLFINVRVAFTTDQNRSSQTISSGKNGPATVGRRLQVYLTGDPTLASELKKQLPDAVRAKNLLFDEVLFVDRIPEGVMDDPLLAIRLDSDGGVWTPVYASRNVDATMLYFQGMPPNSDRILVRQTEYLSVNFTDCTGQCSVGERSVQLDTSSVGLVSLPYIRAYTAGKLVENAAALVTDALPENLNPEKWSSRAHTLAREKLGLQAADGMSTSFQRQHGCPGGVVVAGTNGAGMEWRVMYYDAARDAITQVLTRSDFEAKLPDARLFTVPGFGSGEQGSSLYLGGNLSLTSPAGVCGLDGLQPR